MNINQAVADQAVKELTDINNGGTGGDEETMHFEADKVLCNLLFVLGYKDVVKAWKKVPKWYS